MKKIIGLNYACGDHYVRAAQYQKSTYPIEIKTVFGDRVNERGNGYWRWKPKIILDLLNQVEQDQIVFYFDSCDKHSFDLFDYVIEHFNQNEYFFITRNYEHREWTKGDCYHLMGCTDFMSQPHRQLEAGLIALSPTNRNKELLEEWSEWMKIDQILNDEPSIYPNHSVFHEHRHDQSILTNLIIKYNFSFYLDKHTSWNVI